MVFGATLAIVRGRPPNGGEFQTSSTVLSDNLVMDPGRHSAGSGPAVASSLVSDGRRCQHVASLEGEATTHLDVAAWGLREHVSRSLHKSDRVTVTGPVEQRSSEGEQANGVRRWWRSCLSGQAGASQRSTCPRGHVARVTAVSLLALPDSVSEDAMLTTREAGRLVGRSDGAVRKALMRGRLAGQRYRDQRDHRDYWLVRAGDVLSWAENNPKGHGPILPLPRTEEVAELLRDYGSASAEEVARLLQVHIGNARKYLAILGTQGRAKRGPDGQWVLVTDAEGAA